MININEEIQDRTIRHMVYLERYKASEVRKILKELNGVILPEISAKIAARLDKITERGIDLGTATTARLAQLEKELSKLADDLAAALKSKTTVDLGDLAQHEIDWQIKSIRDTIDFDLEFVLPAPRTIARIIQKTSFAGLTLDQWYESLSQSTQKNVMIAVNRGMVEGETTDQIMRRIGGTKKLNYTDGVWQTTRRQVETITRTTINHAANSSRLQLFQENSDIIKGLKWTSTLDSRTSYICAGLDGRVFPIDKGPRPPAHPNCRSTMVAVIDVDGLDVPESKRASMNGQVSGSTTYGEWFNKQPEEFQKEYLGPSRYKLFKDGSLPIERFTSDNLKPLSLDQLRKIEKDSFKRAGL